MESEPIEAVNLRDRYEDLLHEVTKMRKQYPSACASYLATYRKANADTMINARVTVDNSKITYQSEFLDNEKWIKLDLQKRQKECTSEVGELQHEISNVREVLTQIKSSRHKNLQQ